MEYNFFIEANAPPIYRKRNIQYGIKKTFVNEGFYFDYIKNLFCLFGSFFFFLFVRKLCNTVFM